MTDIHDLPGGFEPDPSVHFFGWLRFPSLESGWVLLGWLPLLTTDGGASWRCRPGGNSPARPVDLAAVDARHCWIAGVEAGPHGRLAVPISLTRDGGSTWTVVRAGRGDARYAPERCLDFLSPQVGWLATSWQGPGWEAGVLFGTQDGGETWHSLIEDLPFLPRQVRFADAMNGWMLAADLEQHGRGAYRVVVEDEAGPRPAEIVIGGRDHFVLSTTDGGRSWQPQVRLAKDIDQLKYRGRPPLVVCGSFGALSCSDDGGRSWRTLETGTDEDIYDVAIAPDDDNFWMAVAGDHLALTSIDGGATWRNDSPVPGGLGHSVHLLPNGRGVMTTNTGMFRLEIR